MRIIYTSTLVLDEDFAKLKKAYGNQLDQVIEKKFEIMMERLNLEAEKELDSRNELCNEEEAI